MMIACSGARRCRQRHVDFVGQLPERVSHSSVGLEPLPRSARCTPSSEHSIRHDITRIKCATVHVSAATVSNMVERMSPIVWYSFGAFDRPNWQELAAHDGVVGGSPVKRIDDTGSRFGATVGTIAVVRSAPDHI